MTPETEKRVLSTIYDTMSDAITYSPSADRPPITEKRTTLLQLANNYALNPDDFKDALNPSNPGGFLSTAEAFSRFIDQLPEVQNSFVARAGKSADRTFGDIVRGANATERPDPAQEQRYLEAYKKLKKSVRRPDGVIDIVDTDNYKRYLDARQAYVDQLSAYRTAYLNFDMTKPRDQQKWNAIEPSLKGKLDRAYNQMIASRSNELELALSTMNSSINSMIRAVIERTKADYNQSSRASVVGDPAGWHLSYAIPTNWYSSEISPSLSDLTITSDRLNTTASSEFTSWGGGASWNAGLWSIGGGVSGSEREERRHMDGQHFKLRFKFGVVQVRRPWFDSTLLQLGGWSLGEAVPRGGISEGKLAGAEAKLMPLIVTSLIIAREIEVEADWTTEDYKHVEKSISGSTRVGWGPFQFSGSYSHSSSNTTFNSTHDGGVLKVPGLQAMAFVSSIMPYSPPL